MRLGSKGRYAVMAMVALARHPGRPVSAARLAEESRIPQAYLEQVLALLRKAGLARGSRGPGGGFALAREASAIAVSEALDAVEEGVTITRCVAGSGVGCAAGGARCATHHLWEELGDVVRAHLASLTLAEVASGAYAGRASATP